MTGGWWYCSQCGNHFPLPHNHKENRMAETHKQTILVDFDGVIHRYSQGWADGTAYDIPFDGAKEGLEELESMGYRVVIFSTRDADQIKTWLKKWRFAEYEITNQKLPALAMIDDRAIRFLVWRQAIDDLKMFYPQDRPGGNRL
jgi:hypothetical protein